MSALTRLGAFGVLLTRRAAAVLRGDGPVQLWRETGEYLRDRLIPDLQTTVAYAGVRRRRRSQLARTRRHTSGRRPDGPSLSVLMPVHDPDPAHLAAALRSVREQRHQRWKLCLVDDASSAPAVREILARAAGDPRVALRRLEPGRGIAGASQAALELATADHVALLDHDDVLEPDALQAVAAAIAAAPEADLLYSDEDRLGPGGLGLLPYFKPDWSPDLLLANMYLGHLLVLRRSLALAVGGFRPGFDGAQDHDLALRASERAHRVVHLPEVLYRWRIAPGSTSLRYRAKPAAADASRRAIAEALVRRGAVGATVASSPYPGFFQVDWPLPAGTRIAAGLLGCAGRETCRRITRRLRRAPGIAPAALWCLDGRPCPDLPSLPGTGTAERLAALAGQPAEVVLLLGRGVVPAAVAPARLASQALRPDVGAVGGLVRSPDGRIRHAGLVPGSDSRARSVYAGADPGPKGYFGSLLCAREVDGLGPDLWAARREHLAAALAARPGVGDPAATILGVGLWLRQQGQRSILEPRAHAVATAPADAMPAWPPDVTSGLTRHYPRALRRRPPDFRLSS